MFYHCETTGIEKGKCIIPKAVTRKEERQVNLRDPCDTFAAIKDKHVAAAFGVLSSESKKLVTNSDVTTPQSISGTLWCCIIYIYILYICFLTRSLFHLSAMKHFVNVEVKAITKLRNSLSLHISVCEEISQRRGQVSAFSDYDWRRQGWNSMRFVYLHVLFLLFKSKYVHVPLGLRHCSCSGAESVAGSRSQAIDRNDQGMHLQVSYEYI